MNQENIVNAPLILIVDDNVNNLHVLGGLLRKAGIKVEFALDGISSLNWLVKKRFDLSRYYRFGS